MLQNMKCETITYKTQPAEISAECVSGPQEARCLEASLKACRAAHFSETMRYLWAWMSAYFSGLMSEISCGAGVFKNPRTVIYVATGDADAPLAMVKLNRSILRRLRRLTRHGVPIDPAHSFDLTAYQTEPCPSESGAYCEYMIRVYRIGRTAIYGLNTRRRDMMRMNLRREPKVLPMAVCNAPLSPD